MSSPLHRSGQSRKRTRMIRIRKEELPWTISYASTPPLALPALRLTIKRGPAPKKQWCEGFGDQRGDIGALCLASWVLDGHYLSLLTGVAKGYQDLVSAPFHSQLLRKILKECLRLDEVGSGEPFSEPRVNFFQSLFRLFSFPLTLPQAAQAHRSPELP